MKNQEIYFSTDVEADGPIPGTYSMLSLGSAAFSPEGQLLDTFQVNLELLKNAQEHPQTMEFWSKNPEAYKATRINTQEPFKAMRDFSNWVQGFNSKAVFLVYPVTYTFMFTHWYLMNFLDATPFSHSGMDIKTLAMVALKCPYRNATKRNMPKRWFNNIHQHTHVAVEDAIEQGELFFNIMKDLGETLDNLK